MLISNFENFSFQRKGNKEIRKKFYFSFERLIVFVEENLNWYSRIRLVPFYLNSSTFIFFKLTLRLFLKKIYLRKNRLCFHLKYLAVINNQCKAWFCVYLGTKLHHAILTSLNFLTGKFSFKHEKFAFKHEKFAFNTKNLRLT